MVLSGRSFFSFAGTLEADLTKIQKTCKGHICKSSVRNINCGFICLMTSMSTGRSSLCHSSEWRHLRYNEISTWAYESSQLLPPCHYRHISTSQTVLNDLQSLPDMLGCSRPEQKVPLRQSVKLKNMFGIGQNSLCEALTGPWGCPIFFRKGTKLWSGGNKTGKPEWSRNTAVVKKVRLSDILLSGH